MSLNPQELFEKLTEQMNLDDAVKHDPLLKQGQVEKVIVHKQSRVWEFYLRFPDILPIKLYTLLHQKLILAFEAIATIDLHILTDQTVYSDELLKDYWELSVHNAKCNKAIVNGALKDQLPFIEEDQIIVLVDNEGIIEYLKQQYLPAVQLAYEAFGFPKLRIDPRVNSQKAEENRQAFVVRQQEQQERMMEEAAAAIEKNEQLKQQKKSDVPALSGPVQMGRAINSDERIIPMSAILDEERSVVIEGYVFDVDVRDLRSVVKF